MHSTGTLRLGCTDCHGGKADAGVASGVASTSPEYEQVKRQAHPQPREPKLADRSANPERMYTQWLKETPEYVRFVNPGDLRVAPETCGRAGCHPSEVRNVSTSMMTTGGMLWGAALYNNGAYPHKDTRFGESYSRDGAPQTIRTIPQPSAEETHSKGVLPEITPLERWEISQPGNVLRVFERGGGPKGEVGEPSRDPTDAGKPDDKLSTRGFGTLLRTDPVFLGLQKTRLLDPLLSLPGTNDQPGDYRASGCTACHVVYANDRSAEHSAQYAPFGNRGYSATKDPTIPREESGHPIRHEFARSIPSSQCMVCHVHPGTNMVTTYFGYTWWDNESDGGAMYPKEQHNPTEEEKFEVSQRNPEGAAPRGLWSDVKFLAQTGSAEFNAKLKDTQFADFHSHGWLFRAVFSRDREGRLLDENGAAVASDDPKKFEKAAHLADIHLQKGMQCVDCHLEQDSHGTGKLYGEPRAAIEMDCVDCHGTISHLATLVTSGPAATGGGTHLDALRTPWRERQFEWRDGKLIQHSMMDAHLEWEVVQTLDSITPGNAHYSEKSRLAKTLRTDGVTWGDVPKDESQLAHANSSMTCYACHTSWTPNCFGCHLSMTANEKRPMLHNEGLTTRNWTAYNFQVLRDDGYMLAVDGTVTGHRVAPARSSCAILVSSQNANREWLYNTQQTVSAEGFSGQAFSTFVPHTVRARETKQCTDCHVSAARDNNAWMSMLLLQGTNFLNFMGRYVYVAAGNKGFEAVATAEHDEPEAVIGSDLQRMAYPEDFRKHEEHQRELTTAYRHGGNVLDIQLRGEYAYAAMGADGFRVFDVANIDNKGFSERMVTAPVSPLGQRLYMKTKYATAIATPTTLAVDPLRAQDPANEEQKIHLMYGFLYVTDKFEGLVVVGNPDLKGKNPGVGTLLDGNPENNFIGRAATFNPGGILNGARRITIAGTLRLHSVRSRPRRRRSRQSARAACYRGNWRARSGGTAGRRRAIPLRFRCRSPRTEVVRRHRSRASTPGARRICECGRRAQCQRVAHDRVCLCRQERNRPHQRRAARISSPRSNVLCGRTAERCERREDWRGRCQRLRLCGRRPQRFAHPASDFAGRFVRVLRIQPASHSEVDCDLSHGRPGSRDFTRHRPRPGRRRERQPARRFRTPRRAPLQPRRSREALSPRRQALHRHGHASRPAAAADSHGFDRNILVRSCARPVALSFK